MQSETHTTPDDVKEEGKEERPSKPVKRSWKSNQLMSLFALLLSAGTFITFAYQNYLIQKQQYGSVRPYLLRSLSTGYDANGQASTSWVLVNNGVGPAFVESFKIKYQGKEYNSVASFFWDGIYANTPIRCGRTELAEGSAIPVGEPIAILTSNDSTAAHVLEEVHRNTEIEIIYSSVYEEKWRSSFGEEGTNKPVKID
ncbi:hypothetical protein [Catalinimonas niigatensis]|uniref:hypothetical protein n=1 Tax=Catalinimonas niigatensis TaxID=1397264 RepID=UPI0026652B86|nr:hypothetical protein [Catalinimonas niigatensis]WPP48447.1 hypothetical protein PZB72_17380 [Catalinimonas niigatensis]